MTSPIDIAEDLYHRFGAGDIDGLLGLLAPDVRWELVGPPEIPYFGLRRGPDEVAGFFGMLGEHLEVSDFTVDRVIGTDTGAVAEGSEQASFRSNGAGYTMRWCHVIRVRDGRIAEFVDHLDTAPILDAWRR